MSRIGRLPVTIPAGVNVEINGQHIKVSGKLGVLERNVAKKISIKKEDNCIVVTRVNETKEVKSLHGLTRALIANMIKGVNEGFSRKLIVGGVGIKGQKQGNKFILNVGYSHPLVFEEPNGVKIEFVATNKFENLASVGDRDGLEITVTGIDKEMIGSFAAKIKASCPVEPYHLYGIRYADEVVLKKQGKTAAAGKK